MKKEASQIAQRIKEDAIEIAQILEDSDVNEKQPKPQTRATAKYQEKVGLISKSYKLKAEDAEAFKKACDDKSESQSEVLTRLMKLYASGELKKTGCILCRLKARFSKKK